MKLPAYGKEICLSLSQQFSESIFISLSQKYKEEIVSALRRQFKQIYFRLPKKEIVQESLAQIHRYHSTLTIKGTGKKESKLLGKIAWGNI